MLIETPEQYEAALKEVDGLMDGHAEPKDGTPGAIRFEELLAAIEAYEAIHHPMQ